MVEVGANCLWIKMLRFILSFWKSQMQLQILQLLDICKSGTMFTCLQMYLFRLTYYFLIFEGKVNISFILSMFILK